MALPDLKPLALGELIDRSVTFWRAHWKPLFKLFLGFELVVYVLTKVGFLFAQRRMPEFFSTPLLTKAASDGQVLSGFGLLAGGFAVILAIDLWVGWWIAAAGTRYCMGQLTGENVSVADGIRRARERTLPLTCAFALSIGMWLIAAVLCGLPGAGLIAASFLGLWSGVGGILLLIGGMALFFLGEGVAFVWYILRFLVTAQVVAIEPVGAIAALRRSNQLISGRIGPRFVDRVKIRATLLLTIVLLVRTIVDTVGGLPALIIQSVYGHAFGAQQDLTAVPQYLLIPAELLSVLGRAVFSPLFVVFAVVFYVDMRVRREGLDLALKLGQSRAA